jgi:hypothetical protein
MRKPLIVQAFAEDLIPREMECFQRAIAAVNGLQAEFHVQETVRSIHDHECWRMAGAQPDRERGPDALWRPRTW